MALKTCNVLKGYGFSRAVKTAKIAGLAPLRKSTLHPSYSFSG
jgi:hypothetical protein